jgi:transcriptional repressor NrdR
LLSAWKRLSALPARFEIEAQEVGLAIPPPLRELDEVAYLRYASVYRNFASLEDFEE